MAGFNFDLPGLESLGTSVQKSEQAKNAVIDNGGQSFQLPLTLPNPTDYLGGAADAVTHVTNADPKSTESLFGNLDLSFSRVAAFVVGILLVGGGILLFKQTQVVIQAGGRAAKRVGEIAAL